VVINVPAGDDMLPVVSAAAIVYWWWRCQNAGWLPRQRQWKQQTV